MSLKLSYFDPRNNLRIGIYIGLFFSLEKGIGGFLAGGIIGLILAFTTAYVVQKTLGKRLEQERQEDDILSHAFVLGLIIAIFGSLLFASFETTPAIALLVCTIVALRSGSKIRNVVKEKNVKKENERIRKLELEKEASDSVEVIVDVQQPLRTETENPIKITVMNPSDLPITNISILAECSRLVRCDEPEVNIDVIAPGSSGYTAIFLYPRIPEQIDLGKIYVAYVINGNYYRKVPIDMGVYEAIQGQPVDSTGIQKPEKHLQVVRETEFYQGFVRLKMAVNNISPLVVNDVALEFDFDEQLFRIDRFEPAYSVKNNRLVLGSIQGNNSKSVMVYFDPMVCSKSSEIKCRIFYKDAKGKLLNTEMNPKRIEVTCPIMKTDSDINIGMLRELLTSLPFRDSKVYRIKSDLATATLMNICREMIQRHDIRHIRTLRTTDRKNYETWYYGKTKVNDHDIILKVTISEETDSIELFGATQTAESLVGMLAEFGREFCKEMELHSKGKSDVKPVVNVIIKDSIIQRSNLLNSCDLAGNCTGDVIVEDSIIQRTEFMANFCLSCGSKLAKDANFCSECGTKIF
ncbi:zinc ribbon domain-containing protein [Methanolobus psychrotolerans]|uniref:zinc ribbon domain-containing protein n=1 Tax=Methanolobus psychrotolerans TaxID=1874706 RepID=UPI000B91C3F8|nr:zinc ribbon domain-containing protein [Methanolobus psychrotolerans]